MKVRVPASTANLGPGFDVLAIALAKYIEVEVLPSDRLSIETVGEGSDFPADDAHLAARVAKRILGHNNVRINISSEIPLARGLGSSAALSLAVAAACGAKDPLGEAVFFEGHGENAAASFRGGLIASVRVEDKVEVRQFDLDERAAFVLLIPDRQLATFDARSVLPETLPRQDAVFNLSRMALLLSGLADIDTLISQAGQDKLHQPYRFKLFPEADILMKRLISAGALMACWSGAGSTVLGICHKDQAGYVSEQGSLILESAGLSGRSELVEPDRKGLVVTEK